LNTTREEAIRTIRAIPTVYPAASGTLYRSRTEAKWAVFLDTLFGHSPFLYEGQGFFLPNGDAYLPDFLLPGLSLYAEVKPAIDFDPDGADKLRSLVMARGNMRGAIFPEIGPGEVHILLMGPDGPVTWEDDRAAWMTCPQGYHHDVQPYYPQPGCRQCGTRTGYWHESNMITAAYNTARNYRFGRIA